MTTDLQINFPFENIMQEEDGSNNWRQPDFANTYLAMSHPVIRRFFAAMEIRLRTAHEASSSPGDNRDILTALKLFLQQEALELSRVSVDQGAMLRDHHSMATTFDQELCRMFLQKVFFGVFFSVAAAICAAVGAIAETSARNNPRWTAGAGVAAAATVVLVAMVPVINWVLDKRRRPVKKRRETIAAMIGAEQLTMGYLRSACEWVSDLQSETVSVLGMVDGDEGDEVAVRVKVAALNHRLQKLRVKANQYGLDVITATEAAFHTIIRNSA